MNYHDLRLKLHKLADQGIIGRAGCYALLEILETSAHRVDIGAAKLAQATLVLDTLAALAAPCTPAPRQQRIAIIGAPESLAATLAAMHAHPYGRELDLTGISITRSELPDVQEKGLPLGIVDLMANDHHRPRPFFSTQLFGPIEDELAALDRNAAVAHPPLAFIPMRLQLDIILDELRKSEPKPKFKGYVGNGKQRRYPRPR